VRIRIGMLAVLFALALPAASADAACKAKRSGYTYKLSKFKRVSCTKAKRVFVKRPSRWECVGTHVGGCRSGGKSFRFFHRI
jgi:hypothetical protein